MSSGTLAGGTRNFEKRPLAAGLNGTESFEFQLSGHIERRQEREMNGIQTEAKKSESVSKPGVGSQKHKGLMKKRPSKV